MKAFSMGSLVLLVVLLLVSSATPALAGSVSAFGAIGSGEIIFEDEGSPECVEQSCTGSAEGILNGNLIGKVRFTATLTILMSALAPNAAGGFCAPASGEMLLTAEQRRRETVPNTLTLKMVGAVCEIGETGVNIPHTFNGTYYISMGTGRFAGAAGSGNLVFSDDGAGGILVSFNGTFKK